MRRLLLVLPFVALAFLGLGAYGPLLDAGRQAMGGGSLRPFLCVGVAYLFVAVAAPIFLLRTRGESGAWTLRGAFWSLAAGAAGAAGALGIVFAFWFGGGAVYVMPLVFGLAPLVSTFVTLTASRSLRQASPTFYLGVLLAALGAAGVLFFEPGEQSIAIADLTVRDFCGVLLSLAAAAVCWGVYGPLLHQGQLRMRGSRLRPWLCVGLAYFGMALLVPLAVLGMWIEPGQWSLSGILWSLAAGVAGSLSALGIILAFDGGGRPIYVMPLVFGCAPLVSALITVAARGAWTRIPLPFYAGLALTMIGAVVVLASAPEPENSPPPLVPPDASPPANLPPPLEPPPPRDPPSVTG